MSPRFSIITTSKGRLRHLRESLPRSLAQSNTEVIAVDYACPDGTGETVRREFPKCSVVMAGEVAGFNAAHARNLGAGTAQGEWLVFLDADVIVAEDFAARLDRIVEAGKFYWFPSHETKLYGIYGSCVIRHEDFLAVYGYDDAIQGYAGEDEDLYSRMRLIKVTRTALPESMIERVIQHSNEVRTVFHKHKAVADNLRINAAYRLVKNTLLRQIESTELKQPARKALYDLIERQVSDALRAGKTTVQILVPLPEDREFAPLREWNSRANVIFELTLRDFDVTPV